MLKNFVIVCLLFAAAAAGFARTVVSGKNVQACRVSCNDGISYIKLKENGKSIGTVAYSKELKKYVSYAYLPFSVPYSHRRVVREFLTELSRSSRLPGKYYIDMSDGLCGYYELSDKPVWQPRDIFKLWPEIYRIVKNNTRLSTVLDTVKLFPLSERTCGDLAQMPEFKPSAGDPGEFMYDQFCVEEALFASAEKKPEFVIDAKKITDDFHKLLSGPRRAQFSRIKQAAEKQDFEQIYQLSIQFNNGDDCNVCLDYAALNGHAKANFYLAVRLFNSWQPEKMMPYLKKAVSAGNADAENFLGHYLYRFDKGTPREIFELFQKAYKHGSPESMASLAHCYWFGFGTERNQKKAFELAKKYLSGKFNPAYDCDFFDSAARTIAGLGYLKFEKNRQKGLKHLQDPDTVPGSVAGNCVYLYGLYGVPQSFGKHDLNLSLAPHWAHMDVFNGSFASKRDAELLRLTDYQ